MDEYVGSMESRLVVSGDLEFTDNVQTTDGNLSSKIVLREGIDRVDKKGDGGGEEVMGQ